MEAVEQMNGTLWIFAALLIGMVIVQSVLFLRLALKLNKKTNAVTKEELNQAFKTGAIATIGPAFSSVTIAISLIALIGPAATFMRCGVVGAPLWEMIIASICASTIGVEFGTPEFTTSVFTLCLFGMILASAPYFLNTIITLKPMDKIAAKSAGKENKKSFLPYMSNAAMGGIIGYNAFGYMTSGGNIIALIASLVTGIIINRIVKKIGNKTLGSFNMAISMIFAMAVGQIFVTVMG